MPSGGWRSAAFCPAFFSSGRYRSGRKRVGVSAIPLSLLAAVIVLSFATLGYFGREIYQKAPPIPQSVVTTDGRTVEVSIGLNPGERVDRPTRAGVKWYREQADAV